MVPNVAGSNPVDRPLCVSRMTTFEAFILGIIQGLTEFLPVSSSGHLKLAQSLFGFEDLHKYLMFDLVCHLGTLLAIFIVFTDQIKQALLTNKTRFFQVILGTLPLFPLVLILKPIKSLISQPELLGYFFFITAFFLYVGIRWGWQASEKVREKNKWRDALTIGMFQAIAILPGVSRSGSTISAGRTLGWNKQDAISFSFLLAIPAILGGVTLEVFQLIKSENGLMELPSITWVQYTTGFFTSFVFGYFALLLLMMVAGKDKFMYFVWYCLFIGIVSLYYFH